MTLHISITAVAFASSTVLTAVPDAVQPLAPVQLQWGPHLAALAGIVALAVLGGVLALRNRLEDANAMTSTADSETGTDEFLTDREKVRQLITENGGRMKQSEIVNAVDWSKAKVSRLLADLEEDGQVTKLRLGRENLVCLSGHEPTASKSPERPQND
ncbi:helix-turn-helix domain-containing protein [Halosolutus amylolyticus]|uniref:Helix-turn-helix domain-containing protein n=1 Tax=Halosolutus amylolyticus TaxID=2932267 RepID=A0ABD5PNK0_9EURY|nr:helix-turn-helix domain-containing protein [Halosolutus amylolyticus]